jgi:uncharacterized membrane protein
MDYFFSSTFLKVAAAAIPIFIVLDFLWLAVVGRGLYFRQLSYLAEVADGRIVFNLPVGLLVQVIIGLGLTVFICLGLLIDQSLGTALGIGAFAGFVLYCTYDLTNLSYIKDYPLPITLIDIAWGTIQGFLAGLYVFGLTRLFGS